MNWNDIITGALVELSVQEEGESVEQVHIDTAVPHLNGVLEIWASKNYLDPSAFISEYTVTSARAGAEYLSIGIALTGASPADFPIRSPIVIESLNYQPAGWRFAAPLNPVSRINWGALITSSPRKFYYQRDYPVGKLYFDGTTKENDKFTISGRTYLDTVPSDLMMDIGLPPGYGEALRLALVLSLATLYGRSYQELQYLAMRAKEAEMALIRRNTVAVEDVDVENNPISDSSPTNDILANEIMRDRE